MMFDELEIPSFFTTPPSQGLLMKIHTVVRVYDTPDGKLVPIDGEWYNCVSLVSGDMYNVSDSQDVIGYASNGKWIS